MAVDPIINDLQYVMETSQEIDILNFYMSFPITCKGRVEHIDRDVVTLKVQPPGSVCLEMQEQTIVLSRGLPEAVRARIISFDLLAGLLKLTDFNYIGSHFGDRQIARVQPDDVIDVTMDTGEQKYTGRMVDVSLSGVGVYVQDDVFTRDQSLTLVLPLPEGTISLPARVLTISAAPEGQRRLAIRFTRNAQEVAVVMRYIKDRRTEILAEIENLYEQSFRSKLSQTSSRGS